MPRIHALIPAADHRKGPTWHLENPLSIHFRNPTTHTHDDERYRLLESVANDALNRVIDYARSHVQSVSF